MVPFPGLKRTQAWVQNAVVSLADDRFALRGAKQWIKPSHSLNSTERIAIYRNMYLGRMHDALAADYPGLQHFFGDHGFVEFVTRYVAKFPSRSYTLNRLGDQVPAFIARSRSLPRREFLHALAKLELAMTQVFDEAETTPLTQEQVAAIPPEKWERARLTPIAAFRMLELDYPAPLYLDAVREERQTPVMRPKRTLITLYRRDYGVSRIEMIAPEYHLLQLIAKGMPLGSAVEKAWLTARPPIKETQLFEWFRHWMAVGLFAAVRFR